MILSHEIVVGLQLQFSFALGSRLLDILRKLLYLYTFHSAISLVGHLTVVDVSLVVSVHAGLYK